MTAATIKEILVERHHTRPDWFIVWCRDDDKKYGEATSLHFDINDALTSADKFKQLYAPAIILDKTGRHA